MQFELLGKQIEISDGRRNYMKILSYYKAMAEQAKKDFRQEYDDIFGSVFLNSTWADKFKKTYGSDNYMDNIVMRYVAKTRRFLANYGVYDLSDSDIWNAGIVATDREKSQLQYEFDMYIIECISKDEDDDSFISRLKSKFKGSYFPNCLYNDIMSLCDFVKDYLDAHKLAKIQFVYKKDVSQAEAIYQNLLDANIPASKKAELAYSLIELDPRSKLYYEYIFENLPQAKYEIVAIAKYLYIDMADLIEKDIKARFDLKQVTTEPEALHMMECLKETMQRYGVSQSVRKTELEKMLRDFDIKARTYDGHLYDTRELRAQAVADDDKLDKLHGDVKQLDKVSCKQYLTEIAHMECDQNARKKHLKLLNDRIEQLDREHLEHLLRDIASCDESVCEQLKNQVEQYDVSSEVKAPFLSQIEERIYTIWDAEDYAKFMKIYTETSVSDSEQIMRNCDLIRETGRTASKETFIKALELLNPDNVETAAKYAVAKEGGLFSSVINLGKKETCEILTLSGKVMHPDIVKAMEAVKAKKGNSFLSGFGFGKNKSKQQTARPETSNDVKYCSACGFKNSNTSKFCSACGNKLS